MKAPSGKFKHHLNNNWGAIQFNRDRIAPKNKRRHTLDFQASKCYKYAFIQQRGLPSGNSGRSEQQQADRACG
jgi:hypothetical protein